MAMIRNDETDDDITSTWIQGFILYCLFAFSGKSINAKTAQKQAQVRF